LSRWLRIKRNNDGTYSLNGHTGRIRGPLKDLLEIEVITGKDLRRVLNRMLAMNEISQVEYNYMNKEIVITVL